MPPQGIRGQAHHREGRVGQGPRGRLMRRSLLAAAAGAVMALTVAPGARAQVGVGPPTATINITSPNPDGKQVFAGPGTTSGKVHADGTGGAGILWVKAALVWAKPDTKPGTAPPVPKARSICGVAPDTDPNPPPPTCQGTGTSDVAFTNAPLP